MVGVNGHDKMKSRLVTGLTGTWISIVRLASQCGTNSSWRGLNVAAVPHRHATTI